MIGPFITGVAARRATPMRGWSEGRGRTAGVSSHGRPASRADDRDGYLRLRHARARHDDRQCLPAKYPGQHVGFAGPDLVDPDLLYRLLGLHDAADERARGA